MTENQLIKLIKRGENLTLEFKESKQKLKNEGVLKRIGPDKGGYWKVISPQQ